MCDFGVPFNRTPSIQEVKKSQEGVTLDGAGKYIASDGLIIFGADTYCEVRAVVGNDLTVNRYNDIYSIR